MDDEVVISVVGAPPFYALPMHDRYLLVIV